MSRYFRDALWGPNVSLYCWFFAVAVAWLSLSGPVRADTPVAHDFRIAPQALASALVEFSRQADVQVLGATEAIQTIRTSGIAGHFTEEQALEQLLKGTELGYRWSGPHTITIAPRIALQPTSSTDGNPSYSGPAPGAQAAAIEAQPVQLEEIVVTAQKRVERLQDVPIPVTAINTQTLAETNQVLLRDYYSTVPGLNVSPGVQSSQDVSIRGITTGGFTNPTVGITIDDMPYAGSTAVGGGLVIPDFDPSDLERIEVLRGPQGTLYGASSMGGQIGYSAGGGATVRALCDSAELFKVGVAVCPFNEARVCPASWADKYCGPAVSVDPPNSASAAHLTGRLLLVAGDLDENVPMGQTLAIAAALIRANRDFDLLLVPNEAHELLLTHGYVQRRVWDYFVRHLLGDEPPTFEIAFEPARLALFARRWLWEFRQ